MPKTIQFKKRSLVVRGRIWGDRNTGFLKDSSYTYELNENELIENKNQLMLKAGDFESVTHAVIVEEDYTIKTTMKNLKF